MGFVFLLKQVRTLSKDHQGTWSCRTALKTGPVPSGQFQTGPTTVASEPDRLVSHLDLLSLCLLSDERYSTGTVGGGFLFHSAGDEAVATISAVARH